MATKKEFEDLTLSEMRDLYNQHSDKPVKKFRSRVEGLRRVRELMKNVPNDGGKSVPRKKDKRADRSPAAEVVEPRSGSKRGQMLEMMLAPKGVTSEEMQEAFEWSPTDVNQALRLLVRKNGYGVREDESGHFHAVKP